MMARPRQWVARGAFSLLIGALLFGSGPARAKQTPQLYTPEALEGTRADTEALVRRLWTGKIAPMVPAAQRAVFDKIQLQFPREGDLFTFTSMPASRELTVPLNTVKFLQDTIYLHFKSGDIVRGEPSVFLYVAALKYRARSEFPGGRYPTPLEAYTIQSDSLQHPPDFGDSARDLFIAGFEDALLFLLSHELGHIILYHVGDPSPEQETEADAFAVGIMQRQHAGPTAVMEYFVLSSLWLDNPADGTGSASPAQSHPLNGARIKAAAVQVVQNAAEFVPDPKNNDPRVEFVRSIGGRLAEIGNQVDSLPALRSIRAAAASIDLATFRLPTSSLPLAQAFVVVDTRRELMRDIAQQAFGSVLRDLSRMDRDLDRVIRAHKILNNRLHSTIPDYLAQELLFEFKVLEIMLQANNGIRAQITGANRKAAGQNVKTTIGELKDNLNLLSNSLQELQAALEKEHPARQKFKKDLDQITNALITANPADTATLITMKVELDPGILDVRLGMADIAIAKALIALQALE